MPNRILVIEDDPDIAQVILDKLSSEGHAVSVGSDGQAGLSEFLSHGADLVVLDLVLPKMDGYEVLTKIRSASDVPVIILSARGEELDKVLGFRMGADDYVVKPFSPQELCMRVQAVLKRFQLQGGELPGHSITLKTGITIDRDRRKVLVSGTDAGLTRREFDLLYLLATRPGHVFTYDRIVQELWETDYTGDMGNLTVLVSRLRTKLKNAGVSDDPVESVRGVGYRLKEK